MAAARAQRGAGAADSPAPAAGAAAPPPEGAKGEVEVVELNRLQQTVARRMAESKATVPHFYLQTEIDMTEAVDGARAAEDSSPATSGRRRPSTTWS